MRSGLLFFLVGIAILGCSSNAKSISMVNTINGSFRGICLSKPIPPQNGAITMRFSPSYDIGVVFYNLDFSGSQKSEVLEEIIFRGQYRFENEGTTVKFIAEDFANDVVVLDGNFYYSFQNNDLLLTKCDSSMTIKLTRQPER